MIKNEKNKNKGLSRKEALNRTRLEKQGQA